MYSEFFAVTESEYFLTKYPGSGALDVMQVLAMLVLHSHRILSFSSGYIVIIPVTCVSPIPRVGVSHGMISCVQLDIYRFNDMMTFGDQLLAKVGQV